MLSKKLNKIISLHQKTADGTWEKVQGVSIASGESITHIVKTTERECDPSPVQASNVSSGISKIKTLLFEPLGHTSDADIDFAVMAHQEIPFLVDEILRLQGLLKRITALTHLSKYSSEKCTMDQIRRISEKYTSEEPCGSENHQDRRFSAIAKAID